MIEPEPLEHLDGNRVRWRGRMLLYFAGCDYFRLSRHPAVVRAAATCLREQGLSVAASRLTTGNHPLYLELENQLARFFQAPNALVMSTGYLTSTVVAQALAGEFSHVLLDERAHPALRDAAMHFHCPVLPFTHRSAEALRTQVRRCGRRARVMVMTDGLFSQDGSVAPLRDYLGILPAKARLLVDDAHGVGVLGRHGRGSLEHEEVDRERIIQCVTLSKAFGAYGGAVLGTAQLREQMVTRSRAFVGSTVLPLPLAAAALASLRILHHSPARRERLMRNADRVKKALRQSGFEVPPFPGPILTVHTPRHQTAKLRHRLLAAGIHASALRYPGVAEGVFRFVISSAHTREQLDRLITALVAVKAGGKSGAGAGSGRTRTKSRGRRA